MIKYLLIFLALSHLAIAQNFITTSGRQLQLEGKPIVLKGLCIGNRVWENVPLPTTHITEADYKRIAAMGANVVRFYFNYLTLEDDINPFNYKQSGWEWLDTNISWAKKYGIYVILNCHVPQGGFQSQCNGSSFWTNQLNQRRATAMWYNIANRYKNETQVAGYDLINEPTPLDSVSQWQLLAQRIIDTVRIVDTKHVVVVERVNAVNCNWSNSQNMNYVKVNDPANNIMYTFHFYSPHEYTHQLQTWAGTGEGGPYPDEKIIVTPTDLKWINGIFNNAKPTSGTTPWTFYEGQLYKITDSTLLAGHAAFVTAKIGSGTIWFDDFVVKEYDENGVFVRDILTSNVEDLDNWDAWSANNTGQATLDVGGHVGLYCLKYTGSTSDASVNNWDNKFEVKYNYSYKISGYIKTKDLPVSSFSMLSISFYNSPSGKKVMRRNKDNLRAQVAEYVQFGIDNNVPLYVGEFGLVRNCFENNKGGDTYINDILNIFDEYQLNYTMHVYREDNFGLYSGVTGQVDTTTATPALKVLQNNLKKNVNSLDEPNDGVSLLDVIGFQPNPTNSKVFVHTKDSQELQILVTDIIGNLKLTTKDNDFDISFLPNGIYLVQIIVNNQLITQSKLIKCD